METRKYEFFIKTFLDNSDLLPSAHHHHWLRQHDGPQNGRLGFRRPAFCISRYEHTAILLTASSLAASAPLWRLVSTVICQTIAELASRRPLTHPHTPTPAVQCLAVPAGA